MAGKPVSLHPQTFVEDSDQDKLLAMSCEEVVDSKVQQESKRTLVLPDEMECEGRVYYRSVPVGLLPALDALSQHKNRSRRLITKCLAHQAVALLSSLIDVDEINKLYREIITMHGRSGGLSTLIEQMDNQSFRIVSDRPAKGEFRAAEKLILYFSDRAKGLGIDTSVFFSVGLVWSLATSQHEDVVGVVGELHPCLSDFRQYVFERLVFMRAFKTVANSRIGRTDGVLRFCPSK